MTSTYPGNDGETLCSVCILAREIWLADQLLDDSLIDWDKLNDLVHQSTTFAAAGRMQITPKRWRDLLDRYRKPGQTMLQLCDQAMQSVK